MDDPETPEISSGEVRVCPRQQTDCVKCRNRKGGKEKQPRHVAQGFRTEAAAQSAKNKNYPESQTGTEEDLPEPAQIQVFKSLRAKPGPTLLNPSANCRVFAEQTS